MAAIRFLYIFVLIAIIVTVKASTHKIVKNKDNTHQQSHPLPVADKPAREGRQFYPGIGIGPSFGASGSQASAYASSGSSNFGYGK